MTAVAAPMATVDDVLVGLHDYEEEYHSHDIDEQEDNWSTSDDSSGSDAGSSGEEDEC